MNTKLFMTASASCLAILGLSLSFIPDEIASYLHLGSSAFNELILQLLGAMYLGFAMLNWMAKGNVLGGIYNKPIAVGNFMHFAVAGLALLKFSLSITQHAIEIYVLTAIYVLFALAFGYVFMHNPKQVENP